MKSDNTPIAAIETTYGGIKYRSRLEARWAVFFSSLEIEFEYEREAYELSPNEGSSEESKNIVLRYLPDFYLPKQSKFPKPLWVEVKGVIGEHDLEKLERLVIYTQTAGVMLGRVPQVPSDSVRDCRPYGFWQSGYLSEQEVGIVHPYGHDYPYSFCECPFCHAFGFEFDGRSARVGCGCKEHEVIANGDKTYNNASPTLLRAYSAALSHRFGT